MSKRFSNKSVLITGAAGGIGRAAAIAFAEEGANLVLVEIKEAECQETRELLSGFGGACEILIADVTDKDSERKMVALAVDKFGQLDVAFNNSGITGPNVDITEYSEADWDRVMNVNLRSIFRAMQEEIKVMRKQGGGAIVNTASVASTVGWKLSSGYSTSKHALMGLTKAAALDAIGDGIRINAVCPGIIDTPLLDNGKDIPGFMDMIIAGQPIGRLGKPEEVARCVLFLASDEASMMVGHGMMVDGGVTVI